VVANVSRGVIADAVDRLAPVRVVEVSAPFTVRVERLVARGRENHGAIGDRLSQAPAALPKGARVITVVNDGTLDDGIARFIAALRESAI
jgi:ribose 1,5-bisphosphokinase PhnN